MVDRHTDPRLRETLEALAPLLQRDPPVAALIGGVAAAYHGLPRATRDIDLLFKTPRLRLPSILEELRAAGCEIDTGRVIAELGRDHLSSLTRNGVRIDLLEPVLPLFDRFLAESQPVEIDGLRVRAIRAEALVVLKLIAFRDRDRGDIRAIHSAQGPKLDREAIKRSWTEIGGEPGDERMRFLGELDRPPA